MVNDTRSGILITVLIYLGIALVGYLDKEPTVPTDRTAATTADGAHDACCK